VVSEVVAVIARSPWPHPFADRKLIVDASLIHVGYFSAGGSRLLTLACVVRDRSWHAQRTSRQWTTVRGSQPRFDRVRFNEAMLVVEHLRHSVDDLADLDVSAALEDLQAERIGVPDGIV
jgi:hypothetical protein